MKASRRKFWSRKVRVEILQILDDGGRGLRVKLASGREMCVPARTRIDLDDYGTRYAVLTRRTWLKARSALNKALP